MNDTALALDHVFILVTRGEASPGGKIYEGLQRLGLRASYTRRHEDQGTANVCFAFDNAFLELLYVVDEAELDRPPVRRTGLTQRARGRGSPLGLAFRGSGFAGEDLFTWPYALAGLPLGSTIDMAEDNPNTDGPMCFGLSFGSPPASWPADRRPPLQREQGFAELRIDQIRTPSPLTAGLADRLDRLGIEYGAGRDAIDLSFIRTDGTATPWSYSKAQ